MNAGDLPDEDTRTVETTKSSFRIIQAVKRREGAGITELAADLEMTKSTVYKHLSTLRKLGYIIKDGTNYRLAVGFLELGVAARSRLDIYELTKQPLEKLSETASETACLLIPEHDRGVYVHQVVPTDVEEPPVHEGERVPLYATAGGRAILAYTSSERRRRIFDYYGFETSTEMTNTDWNEFNRELQRIGDTRISYDKSGYFNGWYCIAAPITDEDRQAVGAITVFLPVDRMVQKLSDSNIPNFLGSTANSIENRIRSA